MSLKIIRRRYKRLGRIRLGEKKVSERTGNEYPSKLPHFNLVDAPAVASVFGGEPKTLAPLILPGNPTRDDKGEWDFSRYWKTSRSAWQGDNRLFCRCVDDDEAVATRAFREDDRQAAAIVKERGVPLEVGDMLDLACPGDDCPLWKRKKGVSCAYHSSFDFVLPTVPGFGVWNIQSKSINTIRNITSRLCELADYLGGSVVGIPLMLQLEPFDARPPELKGKTVMAYALDLVCPFSLQQLAGLRRKALESGMGGVVALIEGEAPFPDDLVARSVQNGQDTVNADPHEIGTAPGASALDNFMNGRSGEQPEENEPAEDDDDLPFGPEPKDPPHRRDERREQIAASARKAVQGGDGDRQRTLQDLSSF